MTNAAEMFIELADKIAPDFVPECLKATGKPQKLSIYPKLLERWRGDFEALAKLGTSEAVDILIETLKYKHLYYRRSEEAAKALGKMGNPQAIPYLIPLPKDKERVRVYSTIALGKIGSKFFDEVEKALLVALKKDPAIKEEVFRALKEMGFRNPKAWVHYKNETSPSIYSPVTELTAGELMLFKKSQCCYTDNSGEYIRVLDRKTRALRSIHTLDCDQVKAAYW